MLTLGINAVYHDCAATIVRDGIVLAAVEEERFTHVKHGKRSVPFTTWQLPFHAIDYCLSVAGATLADVDRFAYSYDPRLLQSGAHDEETITLPLQPSAHGGPAPWDPLFRAYIVNAPRQLVDGAPHHLEARFRGVPLHQVLERWRFVEHHLAHEASAFLAAPFGTAAVLTMDGRGECATTSFGHFDGDTYRRIGQVDLPHSLGLLYEDVTRYLGFLHSSDEYKVMALASYGEPRFIDAFDAILVVADDGTYRVEPPELVRRFGPARLRGGPIEQRHYDLARSLQLALERAVLKLVSWLHGQTGARHLAMAGGVALNCVMNAILRDEGPFDEIWVQPAAGDAGTALGAALWVDRDERRQPGRCWTMEHAYLGPSYEDDEIERFLKWTGVRHRRVDDVADEAAALLAQDRVIGWFQGRMEFGPRALGARSILASPIPAGMQARLNEIKDREDFRPVAPMVLKERAHEWFVDRRAGSEASKQKPIEAPFMLFVFDVRPEKADRIPAVCHVDGTARVQTVAAHQHSLVHRLLTAFEARTGVPVLVNTSFNTRGEPVVCTPRDAIESFWTSPLDALVIGSFILEKERA